MERRVEKRSYTALSATEVGIIKADESLAILVLSPVPFPIPLD
jgi:hypothetical protein